MKLFSPKKIEISKKSGPFQGVFEASQTTTYDFAENGISVTKPIEVFYKSTAINSHQATVPIFAPISEESIESYHFFQNGMNYCINNAEFLNIQLRDLLLSTKTTEEAKAALYRLDFMGQRDAFSKYLNEDRKIRELDTFNTSAKRKIITSTFHQYITDRNIYTHGKLKLLMPDEKFFIDYVLEKRAPARVEITKEIVQSFLDTSKELKRVLQVIQVFLQNEKMSKGVVI